jgi:hypothetical protein
MGDLLFLYRSLHLLQVPEAGLPIQLWDERERERERERETWGAEAHYIRLQPPM